MKKRSWLDEKDILTGKTHRELAEAEQRYWEKKTDRLIQTGKIKEYEKIIHSHEAELRKYGIDSYC